MLHFDIEFGMSMRYFKSGGGGSSSGAVSYSAYLETWHSTWLNNVATAMTTAQSGTSPYNAVTAFDPTVALAAADTAVAAFNTIVDAFSVTQISDYNTVVDAFDVTAITTFDAAVDALDHDGDWAAAIETAADEIDAHLLDDTYINADIDDYDDVLDDVLNVKVLPAFKAGMLNINAVMTSSFVMGEATIWAFKVRDTAQYGSQLRTKLNMLRMETAGKAADTMIKSLLQRVSFEKDVATLILKEDSFRVAAEKDVAEMSLREDMFRVESEGKVASLTIEANRIRIVAESEESNENLRIDVKDTLFDLEIFQYGSNVLASIAGGVASNVDTPSTIQSAIGGALSGAAAGAALGSAVPGLGIGAGAGVGAILGIGASLF